MNNKTFKRVVALVASAVMLCSCAFAATIGEVAYKDGKLTVNYTADGASKAAIMVTKADGTIVAVNQHDGVKTAFNETLDTTKVAIGDVLTIKVGDNAAGSTEAASTTFEIAAETFTVTFMNGEVAYATVPDVAAGTAVAGILPETAPTKEATAEKVYTFAGWYTDAELTTALADDATVAADLTLYAKFEEAARTYTITYVVDGEETTETLAYGATPAPADPVKEGFTFTGWTPEIVAVAGDATYTATFEAIIPDAPAVKVTFVNGAEIVEVEAKDGVAIAPAAPTAPTPDEDALIDRYDFVGWTTDDDTTYDAGDEVPATEAITLYAKYQMYNNWKNKVVKWGDIDGNGYVTAADVSDLIYYFDDDTLCSDGVADRVKAKIDQANMPKARYGDIDGNGYVTAADVSDLIYYFDDDALCSEGVVDKIKNAIYFINKGE